MMVYTYNSSLCQRFTISCVAAEIAPISKPKRKKKFYACGAEAVSISSIVDYVHVPACLTMCVGTLSEHLANSFVTKL